MIATILALFNLFLLICAIYALIDFFKKPKRVRRNKRKEKILKQLRDK